jgi:peptide/nickel transport system permease protein
VLKYILKRIGLSIVILIGVSLIIYFLIRLMPVDFIQTKVNAMNQSNSVPADAVENLYKMYGLDNSGFKGIVSGYFNWLKALAKLDLGKSFVDYAPVSEVIAKNMGISFAVALIATVFEFMIAIPLGITAATHQYSFRDYLVTVLAMIGISLPSFFFGQMLKNVFALNLGWFPSQGTLSGAGSATGLALIPDYLAHMFLPILTVVILSIGPRMRMTRTNMLEVMNSDYIRTARAKGLTETKVIYKHAFRNTLIPLVTTLAGLLPSLFSGAIITEQVFGLDGIGNIALNRMMQGDIPFIMGYNMFLAMLSVLGVLLSDLMYVIVDPRVKLD